MKYESHKKQNYEAVVIYAVDAGQQRGQFAITMSEIQISVNALHWRKTARSC